MVKHYFIILLVWLTSDFCPLTSGQVLLQSRKAVRFPPSSGPATCNSVNDSFLKADWKLDEASGNAIDAKGSNTGVDVGGVASTSGKIGTARLVSSAGGDTFTVADNADLSAGDVDITWGGWAVVTGTGSYPCILSKWGGSGQNEYVIYYETSSSRLAVSVSSTGSDQTDLFQTGTTSADSAYHFFVAWHDSVANTLNIQIDNGTVASVSYTLGIKDGTGGFILGGSSFGTWTGGIDEIFVTKRVLTAGERTALYNSGAGCRPAGL